MRRARAPVPAHHALLEGSIRSCVIRDKRVRASDVLATLVPGAAAGRRAQRMAIDSDLLRVRREPPGGAYDTRSEPLVRRVGRCDSVRRSNRSFVAVRRNVRRSFPARVAVLLAVPICLDVRPIVARSVAVARPGPGTVSVALARRRLIVRRLSDPNENKDDAGAAEPCTGGGGEGAGAAAAADGGGGVLASTAPGPVYFTMYRP